MSDNKDNYQVGYGKPPKNTQFKKGASGNPTGRRKKAPDLNAESSNELNSPITVNDNGKRRRISKIRGIFKQLAHKALAGDVRAARLLLTYSEQVFERAALSEASRPTDLAAKTPRDLSEEELTQMIRDYEESQEWWERKNFLAGRSNSSSAIEQ